MRKSLFSWRRVLGLLGLGVILGGRVMAADSAEIPQPLPQPQWLEDHFRFGFTNKPDESAIDMALADGLTMIAGGTNAGGVGFAGGPWSWDEKNDRFYHMLTGPWANDGKGECDVADFTPIRARIDKAHAKGLKVIGELMTMWDPQQMVEHPEWQMLPTAESKPGKPGNEWGKQIFGCYNSPYGDFYIRKNVALIKKLDWDGQNLDGFGQGMMCYCQFCREGYKKASGGADLPPKQDINDPNCRRYMRWRIDTYNQFVDRWMKGLKAAKSDFLFMPWSSGPQRWVVWEFLPQLQGNDYANRLVDSPSVELLWDFASANGGNLVPSFTVRLYRGICGERRFWPGSINQGQMPQVRGRPEGSQE